MPSVTAKATKKTGENFVRIALSTDGVVPIHQSEGAGKGAWVGVAIEAPEDYEQGTFQYHFGTEASAEATQSAAITEDSSIGQGKYAVFFLNASSTAPKTHITVKWEGQEAVQYVVDLSGVQTPAVKLTGVTVSTHEMPSGVSSTAEGLSFDGSTALVQNGGTGALTHTQVASMGGGGEYTVYYTVPQAIPGGTLQFDKIARSVNGGKWNAWAMPAPAGGPVTARITTSSGAPSSPRRRRGATGSRTAASLTTPSALSTPTAPRTISSPPIPSRST